MNKGRKIKSKIALLLSVLMVLVLALAACGGSDKDVQDDSMGEINPDYTSDSSGSSDGMPDEGIRPGEEGLVNPEKPGEFGQAGSNPLQYAENVKLIYMAYLNLQTTEFETAEAELIALVTASEGYFEASYTDRGNYYSDESYLSGTYVVRVPADKYEAFLASVGKNCHVVSLNKTTTDVGMDYFDTEARLNTLKAKQERLMALLNKATTMSDIIELENALSNAQYEIDMYTSTINRYDSLIGFSTVEISLQEVARLSTGVDEEEGFFASLGRSLVNGFNNFVDGVESLIMWVAYHLIELVIVALILTAGGKWYLKRRKEKGPLFRKLKEKMAIRKTEKASRERIKKEEE